MGYEIRRHHNEKIVFQNSFFGEKSNNSKKIKELQNAQRKLT